MENYDVGRLIDRAVTYQFNGDFSCGNWGFEGNGPGSFSIHHDDTLVVACKDHQIIDARWGSRIEDIEVSEILSVLLDRVPALQLDPKVIRTDDCFSVLGYPEHSMQISSVPGLEDVDYYRAWVTSKANERDPEKKDYIVYWDQGNTWCEVLAVFERVTHDKFVTQMWAKYNEWIQEEEAMEAENTNDNLEPAENIGLFGVKIDGAVSEEAIQELISRTVKDQEGHHVCDYKCTCCGSVFEYDEEVLWGHLQMDHEAIFEECQGWETPFMLETYFDEVPDRSSDKTHSDGFNINLLCDLYSDSDLHAFYYLKDYCSGENSNLVQDLINAYYNFSYTNANKDTSITTEKEYIKKKQTLLHSFGIKESPAFRELIPILSLEDQIKSASLRAEDASCGCKAAKEIGPEKEFRRKDVFRE